MPELNREDIIKALECCSKSHCSAENNADCPLINDESCACTLPQNALTLIKQLTEENESLGIENEVQRLNLGNTRDDLNNAECDVVRLKRENTALEREVERLKADVVPRSEVERLEAELEDKQFRCDSCDRIALTSSEHRFCVSQAKQDVAREIFDKAFDYPTLADWYISSVDDRDTPVWTDEHIEELLNDFYVIPKEIADGYKM